MNVINIAIIGIIDGNLTEYLSVFDTPKYQQLDIFTTEVATAHQEREGLKKIRQPLDVIVDAGCPEHH